ncbi:MAG: pirin family protein [Actinobacteria bacterium]|nr:pirin family protein [Actinomycetota bacterium]
MSTPLREIAGTIQSQRTVEGGGFTVRRPFPTAQLEQIDPFLLLDEMGPADYAPGKAVGAPSHPHRGFETVTYMLSGSMVHEDSTGTKAVIKKGGVQWMTAGSGVIHSELPTDDMIKLGGRMHGFQLWVNLPAARKMIDPRYQGYEAEEMATVQLPNGGHIRVVAGIVHGAKGPVETTTPMTYAHAVLEVGDVVEWLPDEGHTALVHIFDGGAKVNGSSSVSGEMVVMQRTAGLVRVEATQSNAQILLLGGLPLGEPVVRYGPFVMNTKQEIITAVEEYNDGKLVKVGKNSL